MKYIKNRSNFIAEEKTNEMLNIDSERLHRFLEKALTRFSNTNVASIIQDYILTYQVDPYYDYFSILEILANRFRNNKEVIDFIASDLQENI